MGRHRIALGVRRVCWAGALWFASAPLTVSAADVVPATGPGASGATVSAVVDVDSSHYRALVVTRAGSSSSSVRKQAIAELPLRELTPQARAKAERVLNGMGMFRQLPTLTFDVEPRVYHYLLQHPDVAVVAFTAALSLAAIDGALDAGCRGVVPKTADAPALVHAIDMARRGERHLHPRAVAMLLGRLRDPSPVQPLLSLSPRERALLHMAEGRSNRAIGHELGISETTVKTHVAHVLRKLGAADRAQAVGRALRSGVIS